MRHEACELVCQMWNSFRSEALASNIFLTMGCRNWIPRPQNSLNFSEITSSRLLPCFLHMIMLCQQVCRPKAKCNLSCMISCIQPTILKSEMKVHVKLDWFSIVGVQHWVESSEMQGGAIHPHGSSCTLHTLQYSFECTLHTAVSQCTVHCTRHLCTLHRTTLHTAQNCTEHIYISKQNKRARSMWAD